MPLKDKLRHEILVGALAGSVGLTGLLSGCTSEEMDNFSNFMLGSGLAFDAAAIKQSNLGNYQSANTLRAMGDAARFTTSNQNVVRAAEAGRSEVNVYNSSPQEFYRETIIPQSALKSSPEEIVEGTSYVKDYGNVVVGTCNYSGDFDNNGIFDYPEDFLSNNKPGMKKRFRENEKITLVFGSGIQISDLNLKLFDSEGRITDSFRAEDPLWGLQRVYNFEGEENDSNLSPGSYRAIWYSGNRFLSAWTFEVENER